MTFEVAIKAALDMLDSKIQELSEKVEAGSSTHNERSYLRDLINERDSLERE
ncbi:hypothetical protein [Vibrio sp. Evd11]|uniref:hypothetical protein n=1 Tax=Vibrio sp. Evd11 TaxID=1207404 RepID=UPI0013C43A1E|nr:hypothetical protein [Vibrio sp. Evd11]